MPRIASWNEFPSAVRAHLVERMARREISIQDLNLLRLWIETNPLVPEGDWYKRLLDIQNLRNGKISENIFVGRAGRERHQVVAVAIAVAPCSDRGGWLRAIRERALIRRKPAALPRSKGSLRQAQGRLFCATVRFQLKLDGGASG